jgi:Ras homolog gene family, member A
MADPPEVTILLLGDTEVGKTTFLSYVSPSVRCVNSFHAHYPASWCAPLLAFSLLEPKLTWIDRRISKGSTSHLSKEPIAILRDNDQPFIFDISFFNRPYRFQFYDTASPENWTLLQPDVIVLCYDLSSRLSLINIQRVVRSLFLTLQLPC